MVFNNKKTLYEVIRVQTWLTMIVDHTVAQDSSRETKNWIANNWLSET